jgi:DNA-binding beta-propeller fold protein YncE
LHLAEAGFGAGTRGRAGVAARWDAAPVDFAAAAVPDSVPDRAHVPPHHEAPRVVVREGGRATAPDEAYGGGRRRLAVMDEVPADEHIPPRADEAPEEREPARGRGRWLIGGVGLMALLGVGAALLVARGPDTPAATTFHVPGQPTGLAASDGKVWVAGPTAGAVWVLDEVSGKPAAPALQIGGTPARLALEARFAWIADTERSSVIRAPRAGKGALRSIRTGPDLSDVAVAGGRVWTASSADGTVRAFDARGRRQVLHVGVRPIALAGDARRVVVLDSVGTLIRLDARTGRQVGPPVTLGGTPVDVALVDDVAWVADANAGNVRAVTLATGRLGPTTAVGRGPVAIAADAGGVYVLCGGDRTLVGLDSAGDVRSRLVLQDAPTALALDSRHIWIAAGTNEVVRVDR